MEAKALVIHARILVPLAAHDAVPDAPVVGHGLYTLRNARNDAMHSRRSSEA
jgi:hypothetical protein